MAMMKYRLVEYAARLIRIISPSAFIFLLLASAGQAETVSGGLDKDAPWRIQADRIAYRPSMDTYTAEGDVVITHLGNRLTADTVQFQSGEMIVDASGNVFFSAGEDTLEGDRLVIDMADQTGTLYSGSIFIKENNFRIKGDRIMKTGQDSYSIGQACLTTCDPENPDWSITGTNVNVTVEGYGTATHAAFRIRNTPVFYVPYLVFPAKTKRQSGLLFPHLEYSSRNGFEFIQPYFWAISDHTDATFYYHHIQNRGEKGGLEFRYMASERSKGAFMIDAFEDRKVDDDMEDPHREWGYTEDGLLRPNSDRYWLRMKADQTLPSDFMARLDLDVVSDQDYLRDFRHGYTGHGDTESYFASAFDRGIDDRNDHVRENRLNVSRNWTFSSVNADLIWYDDVVKRRLEEKNDTLQRLPMIRYDTLKQPLYRDRLYGSAGSSYSYFFREDGVTGHRADLYPRLSMPFYPFRHFTFEPSAGYRQTVWYTDADRDDIAADSDVSADMQRYTHRGIYDISADLSTDFYRVFPVSAFDLEKVKHGILPRLRYSYIPDVDQSEYPDFDDIDRIEEENRISLSMTHFFTSKRTLTRPDNAPEASYNMFARFMIEQPYDFDYEEKEDAFLPLYVELDVTPERLFTLHADAQYGHREDAFIKANTSLRVKDLLGADFRTDYRYTRDTNKTLYFRIEAPVRAWLTVYGDLERSLIDHINMEMSAGFQYRTGCWSADISYRALEDIDGSRDERYYLLIHLYGLGEFGK